MSYLSSRRHAGSHLARWRTAHLFFFSYQRLCHINSQGGTTMPLFAKQRRAPKLKCRRRGFLPPQNSKFAGGLCPPFFGGCNFLHPLFFEFWARGIPLGRPGPALTTAEYHSLPRSKLTLQQHWRCPGHLHHSSHLLHSGRRTNLSVKDPTITPSAATPPFCRLFVLRGDANTPFVRGNASTPTAPPL